MTDTQVTHVWLSQRIVFWIQPLVPFVLIAWGLVAPGISNPLGDSGYGALFLLLASPFLIAAMLVPALEAWVTRRVRQARATSRRHTVATEVMWVAGILAPFFFGASSDVPTSPSLAEHWGLSSSVAGLMGVSFIAIAVLAWIIAVIFARKDPRARS